MARSNSESSNEHNLVDKYFGIIPALVITNQKNEKWGINSSGLKNNQTSLIEKTNNFIP